MDGKRVVGTFEHACGFAYRRFGPDTCRANSFKKQQVVCFGLTWEEECRKLLSDSTLSWRARARLLGVDVATVQARGISLRPRSRVPTRKELRNRRSEWRALGSDHPSESRKTLRMRVPGLYTWLYRHDRQWLMRAKPAAQVAKRQISRVVNWGLRDKTLAALIEPAANTLRAMVEPPVRASRAAIAQAAGIRSILERHLNKLPFTRAVLDQQIETAHAFRERRLEVASERLREIGNARTRSSLLYTARIRPVFATSLEETLRRLAEHE